VLLAAIAYVAAEFLPLLSWFPPPVYLASYSSTAMTFSRPQGSHQNSTVLSDRTQCPKRGRPLLSERRLEFAICIPRLCVVQTGRYSVGSALTLTYTPGGYSMYVCVIGRGRGDVTILGSSGKGISP
jgi:hypothetical protein